jgi:hypothetical protein
MTEKSQTPFKRTTDEKAIRKIVNERLLNMPLAIEHPDLTPRYVEIVKYDDEGMFVFFNNFEYHEKTARLNGFISDFYFELEIIILDEGVDNYFNCKPEFIRISTQKRSEPRFRIGEEHDIFVKNIIVPKNVLKIHGSSIPIAYQVLMEKYNANHQDMATSVSIGPVEDKKGVYREIADTGQNVFIADLNHESSFSIHERDDQSLDVKSFYGENFESIRKELLDEGTAGWIIYPIAGPVSTNANFTVGYIELKNETPFDNEKLTKVKLLAREILDRLLDMETYENDNPQRILDISKSGLKLHITDKKLIEAVHHRKHFLFDILIKRQAPITVRGWIRNVRTLNDGSMVLCVKIQVEDEYRDHLPRLYEYIDSLAQHAQMV